MTAAKTGRIITARHGRPDLDRSVWITGPQYADWWRDYDKAGLADGEAPTPTLIEFADVAHTLLSSNLPRAVETAQRASRGARAPEQDPIYGEAHLPAPPAPFLKLQAKHWGVISRTLWFLGYAPKPTEGHRDCWVRVHAAADRLIERAQDGDVLLCAHGYFNWMLDRILRGRGWTRIAREGGNHYWSWRAYAPPAKQAVEADAHAENAQDERSAAE